MPLLTLDNLTVEFDTDDGVVHAVNKVSFSMEAGETVGIVGESGCGKTVTAMSVLRLLPTPPARTVEGRIEFQGADLLTCSEAHLRAIRGAQIGMIFQEPMTALSPLHRICEQLCEVFELHTPDLSRREQLSRSAEMLERVGIADVPRCLSSYPHELSGGMRQRVMIAMALLLSPQLIVADEPTTALDVTVQAQILDLLKDTVSGKTDGHPHSLLLITHDLGVIWQMCTKVIVMYASRIVEEAPVRELFKNPRHPYTRALLASIPALCQNPDQLQSIEGSVPSLIEPLPGCPFAPRCPQCTEKCVRTLPDMQKISEGHYSRCHYS